MPDSSAPPPPRAARAREEETIGLPASKLTAKGRVTPRQLWQRMERDRALGRTPPPIQYAEQPSAASPDAGQSPGQNAPQTQKSEPVSALEQQSADEHLDALLSDNLRAGETMEKPSVNQKEAEQQPQEQMPSETESQTETPPQPAQTGKREAVMVQPEKQPGRMKYPYATHGPAPEPQPGQLSWTEHGERRVSSAFVLGVLIVVVSLLIGLVLVRHHLRLSQLEKRVAEMESVMWQSTPSGRPAR
jgi:hypothetical protein